MTLRLTVQEAAWRRRVGATAADYDHRLIAVIKGNGYGLGRAALAALAAELLGPTAPLAVGTAYELAGLPRDNASAGTPAHPTSPDDESAVHPPTPARVHVLVPARSAGEIAALHVAAAGRRTVAMVDCAADVARLDGVAVDVTIKLATSMRRFGADPADVPALAGRVTGSHRLDGFAAHLPLVGSSAERAVEAAALLDALDALDTGPVALPRRLSLSHLDPADVAELRRRFAHWELPVRLGTALWHGTKHELHLGADVVAVSAVAAGERAGYHGTPAPADGWLVIVGAGSANGVAPLDDGRSPFHHHRRRVALLEPPHMHSSMLFVPRGDAVPAIGETVDVQRPLTQIAADEVCWT